MIRKLLMAASALFAMDSIAGAINLEKGEATTIAVRDNSATMLYHKDMLVTTVSGAVGSDGIPTIIRLGDVIRVKDRKLIANHILWTKYLERAQWGKEVLAEAGTVTCVIVENLTDLPQREGGNKLWINVKNCEIKEKR